MRLVASRVNRPDVNHLFPRGVRKASPHQTQQANRNQDDSKCFIHGTPLPPLDVTAYVTRVETGAFTSLTPFQFGRPSLESCRPASRPCPQPPGWGYS